MSFLLSKYLAPASPEIVISNTINKARNTVAIL